MMEPGRFINWGVQRKFVNSLRIRVIQLSKGPITRSPRAVFVYEIANVMRLLDTSTLEVKLFITDIPEYAVLSHIWEEDEVLFQDLHGPKATLLGRKGHQKVTGACKRASEYGFDWIWIDSCCINKESSAELSEAINSMYMYYERAGACYAYLSDVESGEWEYTLNASTDVLFWKSRWFIRGWTLQELLAPIHVEFFDKHWVHLGSKWSRRDVVSAITGIPINVLLTGDMSNLSIAQKMSWAARRETTRKEDRAYSLMGMFGVNMPPIYGEGEENAFLRLQQEIIKRSDDRSIFAWKELDGTQHTGFFASSPLAFDDSGGIGASDVSMGGLSSYSLTNNGLHIHLPLMKVDGSTDIFLAFLNCKNEKAQEVAIYVRKLSEHQYQRCWTHRPLFHHLTPELGTLQEIFVKQNDLPLRPLVDTRLSIFELRLLPSFREIVGVKRLFPASMMSYPYSGSDNEWPDVLAYEVTTPCPTVSDLSGTALAYECKLADGEVFVVIVGFDLGGVYFSNIRAGPQCTDIQVPYYMDGNRDCRGEDRVLKDLEGGGRALLVKQISRRDSKPDKDKFWWITRSFLLEIRVIM
ncbi:hypothetical protein VKT23_009276 [Stygiomarasmius scandens]|uniref:Heterokaryon incompatibility domain-containing protein n=1 Tax=Marasmiellus scandens TaxID=2682957 RepID=A0ABR1JEX9_9AGAR